MLSASVKQKLNSFVAAPTFRLRTQGDTVFGDATGHRSRKLMSRGQLTPAGQYLQDHVRDGRALRVIFRRGVRVLPAALAPRRPCILARPKRRCAIAVDLGLAADAAERAVASEEGEAEETWLSAQLGASRCLCSECETHWGPTSDPGSTQPRRWPPAGSPPRPAAFEIEKFF